MKIQMAFQVLRPFVGIWTESALISLDIGVADWKFEEVINIFARNDYQNSYPNAPSSCFCFGTDFRKLCKRETSPSAVH